MQDKQFVMTMMMMLGVLVAFTIFIMVVSNVLTRDVDYSEDNLAQKNIEQRVLPVGSLTIAGVTPDQPAGGDDMGEATAASDAGAGKSAEELYSACAACHDAGILNSPKLGDQAGWTDRLAKGTETLYANAINGLNAMPAKGGRADYSDDDVRKVVDYMLESIK